MHQREFLRHPGLADDFERGSCRREVADLAIDRAAVELDRSGLQYPMTGFAT
jgi:hypothetical protein